MITSQSAMRYVFRAITATTLSIFLSACAGNQAAKQASFPSQHEAFSKNKNSFLLQTSQDEFEELVKNVDIKSRLLDQYAMWEGVSYRLGGTTKRGIDCSAFVQRTFSEQFGIDLPRSTTEQSQRGESVRRSNLLPGDLVMFRAGSTGHHIGIYLENNRFVHASTSSGVTISDMNSTYWKNRFQQARRVLKG